MTKPWETKKKILDLLSKGDKTLSDISDELGLAPSTVNQHLNELLLANAIEPVENPHIKKWKYYRLNPNFNFEGKQYPIIQNTSKFFFAILLLALVLGILYYLSSVFNFTASNQTTLGNKTSVFSISDSPLAMQEYTKISAINLSVSSLQVHSVTTGKWYVVLNSTKSFDLIHLRDISELVANANLPAGQYDTLLLNISTANATVNNVSKQLFLPSKTLRISDSFNVSGNTTNWVNLDFNLFQSIKIAISGKVIMLPVINLTYQRGARLSAAKNGIISVNSSGQVISQRHFGMYVNGTLLANASVPSTIPLNVSSSGLIISSRAYVTAATYKNATIAFRDDKGITFINQYNGSQYGSANSTLIASSNFGTNLPSSINLNISTSTSATGTSNATVACQYEDSMYECDAGSLNVSLNATSIPSLISQLHHRTKIRVNQTINTTLGHVTLYGSNVVVNKINQVLNTSFDTSVLACNNDNSSSRCVPVSTSVCNNGEALQTVCVPNNFKATYLQDFSNSHQQGIYVCPMFMLLSQVSCGCVSNYCVTEYSSGTPLLGTGSNSTINSSVGTNITTHPNIPAIKNTTIATNTTQIINTTGIISPV